MGALMGAGVIAAALTVWVVGDRGLDETPTPSAPVSTSTASASDDSQTPKSDSVLQKQRPHPSLTQKRYRFTTTRAITAAVPPTAQSGTNTDGKSPKRLPKRHLNGKYTTL